MKFYKKLYLLPLLNILHIICFQKQTNFSYINNNIKKIQEAIYIIRNDEGNVNLEYDEELCFINNEKISLKKYFEIIKDKQSNNKEDFYFIQDYSLKFKIASNESNNIINYSNSQDKDFELWKIIPKINKKKKTNLLCSK